MARLPRFLRTKAGLCVALALAAAAVWGVTWASTLSAGGGPVAAASSAARTTPSPSPSQTPVLAPAATPTPTPSAKPTRGPRPSPSPTPTPARTPTASPAAGPTPSPSPTQASATAACTVAYRISSSWDTGFVAAVAIANTGSTAWNGWTLAFVFSGNQAITDAWNGIVTQRGTSVTVKSTSSNGAVAAGKATGFGFQASYSGRNVNPASFTVNGLPCTTV